MKFLSVSFRVENTVKFMHPSIQCNQSEGFSFLFHNPKFTCPCWYSIVRVKVKSDKDLLDKLVSTLYITTDTSKVKRKCSFREDVTKFLLSPFVLLYIRKLLGKKNYSFYLVERRIVQKKETRKQEIPQNIFLFTFPLILFCQTG